MSEPAPYPTTYGLILAGGLARRMGGGDKPLQKIGGSTILARAIAALDPQCEGLLLNANGDPTRFATFGLPVIADGVPGFVGPLAGILAGLDWLAENRPRIEWLASIGGDSPFIPNDFVTKLHSKREQNGVPLAVARSGGQAHPVNALWPVALRDDLRRALVEENLRKIDRWTARHGVANADWDGEPIDPFFNANTPADVAEAERLLG